MGSLDHHHQESPPLPQDLKVTIQHSSLVFPSQETEKKSLFLSNIDQVLNFSVETVHFFASHKDFPPHVVAEKLRNTLGKILVPYDFLAGRLKANAKTGKMEIDCNAAGAVFIVASSEYKLDDIGDLVYPNPGFKQLIINSSFDDNLLEQDDKPLCIFQVTSFKCGGFSIGTSTNHATFDGLSFKVFLDNLAALAADKPLAIIPCNDRRLLAARSPPRVTFDHPEMLKLKMPFGEESNNAPIFDITQEDLDFKIFRLTPDDIANLKEKAKATVEYENSRYITGFNVVSALIWRCKALSYDHAKATVEYENSRYITGFNVVSALIWRCKALSYDHAKGKTPERESRMLYAVDIRPRLNPPLPASYVGNAVLSAYANAKCEELKEKPFSRLVEMVSEGAKRMSDEYARSAIDWGETYKGFPHGEFLVSSWWKLGFSKVEYPWGKPKYSCPVVYHKKDIILLFPNIDNDNGVNVLVSLPSKEMVEFESLFNKFLA